MKVKQKALDEVNEITYDTKTGITTTLVHTFKPCIDLFDGNEHIAHYENDTEFIEDFKKMKQENKQLKDNWNKLKEYIRKNIIYDDVGMKILDPSPLEDYMQELEQGGEIND